VANVDLVGAPPLSVEVACGRRLEDVTESLRAYVQSLGRLTSDALLASSTVEQCTDIFDKELWETGVGLGTVPRTRFSRLTARRWASIADSLDLRGLFITARPRPHVPERASSSISLETTWYDKAYNRVTFTLPARYIADWCDRDWLDRCVEAVAAFAQATDACTAYIGWTKPMGYLNRPVGTEDFTTHLMDAGWWTLLRETHLSALGGRGVVDVAPASIAELTDTRAQPMFGLRLGASPFDRDQMAAAGYDRLKTLRHAAWTPPTRE
jgi:hypothetical protein